MLEEFAKHAIIPGSNPPGRAMMSKKGRERKQYVKPQLRKRERLAKVTEGEVPTVTDGRVPG